MKVTLKVWDALNGDEESADEVVFDDWGWPFVATNWKIQAIAQDFVEKHWADNDHPDTTEVNIRKAPDGELLELIVSAQQSVDFLARPKHR